MTRISKIARLPKDIRLQLNRRLQNGQPAHQLVHWLNAQKPVKSVLKDQFGGRPISEQNLSDWKTSGYLDWEHHEEAKELVQQLQENADGLHAVADDIALEASLATVLMAELIKLAKTLLKPADDPQARWRQLCHVNRELSRLSRDKARNSRRFLQEERQAWDREDRALAGRERECARERKQKIAVLEGRKDIVLLANLEGGKPTDLWRNTRLYELRHDLPEGRMDFHSDYRWEWANGRWISEYRPRQPEPNPVAATRPSAADSAQAVAPEPSEGGSDSASTLDARPSTAVSSLIQPNQGTDSLPPAAEPLTEDVSGLKPES